MTAPKRTAASQEGAEGLQDPEPRSRMSERLAARLMTMPDARALGRLAYTPWQMPWRGWKAVIRRTLRDMISDRISLIAAGCTFYAVLALFPAISMLVSLYGLVFDPNTVEPQLQVLQRLLPPESFHLIADRVHQLVSRKSGGLGVRLAVSVLITLWSSATGTKSMLSALNMAYGENETRSFLRFQAIAFAMTLGVMLVAVLSLAGLVALPAVIGFFGLSAYGQGLIQAASFLVLLVFVMLSLSLLYRFGPSRRVAKWQWITPGSLVATVLWLAVSVLFSFYVGNLASYDVTYGSLGTAIGIMMWFYVTVYVVLLGAELNAELELQTARDSTEGPPKPIGARGAYVADNIAEE